MYNKFGLLYIITFSAIILFLCIFILCIFKNTELKIKSSKEYIRITGSSTLYPFITVAAEKFGLYKKQPTPIVEANGTGSGFKLFCINDIYKSADMVNASRPMKDSEKKLCSDKNINNIEEIIIGYDGVIVANALSNIKFNIKSEELFLALSSEIPKNGKLVPNFYSKWSEINKNLPNYPIEIYGPSTTSGTRDTFTEIIMVKSCATLPEFIEKYPDPRKRELACSNIRNDGAYIDVGENDNIIINKLYHNKQALGIIGYNFLIENDKFIQSIRINNTEANYDTILNGNYILSRALYIYINKDHIGYTKNMREFIDFLTGYESIGPNGFLTSKGLIN